MKPPYPLTAILLLALCSSFACQAQILIGQTASMSGPSGVSVNETISGAQLVIDSVNGQGGVHGEKIEIVRMDDGYDAQRAAESARVLIEDKGVVAMFMTRGTPQTTAIIPVLNKNGVALIGPSTGAMVLHKPVQKNVFNVRPTYQREAERTAQHLLMTGLTRVAIVHATDSFGRDGLEGALKGFNQQVRPATIVAIDRDSPNYTEILSQLTAANAQAVLWIGASSVVANGVKALRAAGSGAQVATLSNNASSGFIQLLGKAGSGVIVSQVFPNERMLGMPIVRQAHDLAEAKGKHELSPAMLEGFASAKVLVEALKRAGPKPTRARIVAALESMNKFDLGGLEVSYSPKDHSGIDFVDLSIISDGKFKR